VTQLIREEILKADSKNVLELTAMCDEHEVAPDGSKRTTYKLSISLGDAAAAVRLRDLQGTAFTTPSKDKLVLESVDIMSQSTSATGPMEAMVDEYVRHFYGAAEPPHDERFAASEAGMRPDTVIVRGIGVWLDEMRAGSELPNIRLDHVRRVEIIDTAGGAELLVQFDSVDALRNGALLLGTHSIVKGGSVKAMTVDLDRDGQMSNDSVRQRRTKEHEMEQLRKRKRPDQVEQKSTPAYALPKWSELGSLKKTVLGKTNAQVVSWS
jgi:hypothetical protein